MSTIRTWLIAFALGLLSWVPSVAFAQGTTPKAASTTVNPRIPRLADIAGVGDPTLVADLRKGGYVIFFRHAATNWSERDRMGMDFENRALQRNLSEAGKADAAGIGEAFKALAIPIGSVFASPMWRCRDTAQIAFGLYQTKIELFGKVPEFQGGGLTAASDRAGYRATRLKMLSTAPSAGANRVLVGQQDPMIPIIPGLHRDELREGDALVIHPLGGGNFKIVSQITPADWMRLAAAYPAAKSATSDTPPAATKSSK
ncbi:MAG TPA: histidine phosphatase family protein [Candidatus Eisenbacteria bacterium]|jgi:phosphohistidine phosphatase SixA